MPNALPHRHVLVIGEADGATTPAPLAEALRALGWEACTAPGRSGASHEIDSCQPDIAIIVARSEEDADVVAHLRVRHARLVVACWLADGRAATTAALLDAGADEVVHAGMHGREVVSRLRAAARRRLGGDDGAGGAVTVGDLCVDAALGAVTWRGIAVTLSRREREVLAVLARSPGKTVPRTRIYRHVWGFAMARGDRSVDVNVRRLRARLAAAGAGDGSGLSISTIAGVGYRLDAAAVVAPDDRAGRDSIATAP